MRNMLAQIINVIKIAYTTINSSPQVELHIISFTKNNAYGFPHNLQDLRKLEKIA